MAQFRCMKSTMWMQYMRHRFYQIHIINRTKHTVWTFKEIIRIPIFIPCDLIYFFQLTRRQATTVFNHVKQFYNEQHVLWQEYKNTTSKSLWNFYDQDVIDNISKNWNIIEQTIPSVFKSRSTGTILWKSTTL